MDKDTFINSVTALFEVTPADELDWKTEFKKIEEWDSLLALEIIAMVDEEFDIEISGDDIREAKTLNDLYSIAKSK